MASNDAESGGDGIGWIPGRALPKVYGDSLWLETGLQTGWNPACQIACEAERLTRLRHQDRGPGRAERVETNELELVGGHHGPTHTVGKASFGAVRDFRVREHVSIGVGGLYSINVVPDALEPSYDGDPDSEDVEPDLDDDPDSDPVPDSEVVESFA